jgi:hypothetical protein
VNEGDALCELLVSSVSTTDACEIPWDASSFRLLTISGSARRAGHLTLRRIWNTAKAGTKQFQPKTVHARAHLSAAL